MTIAEIIQRLGATEKHGSDTHVVPVAKFAASADMCVQNGAPLVFMYASDDIAAKSIFAVHAVFSVAGEGFIILRVELKKGQSYQSLTRTIMAAHWFERLIHDQFGVVAEGHPDWRRLMHHENIPEGTHPLRKDFKWDTKLAHANVPYPMHAVEGKGVYEIPVGPIHAGIIEPGHFRFNVRGERILTLEGKLFFKHKGVEKILEGKTPTEAMPFIDRISGDMAVGHALAFSEAVERARNIRVSERAQYLRVVWDELERTTAHVFDIGNIAGMGTGFTFMAAQGFRMVEELRRLHQKISGHRYLRGTVFPGGAHDLKEGDKHAILSTLGATERDLRDILDVAYAKDGLMERFETTGILSRDAALAYGARGVAARGSGVDIDMRRDHPTAAYAKLPFKVHTKIAGDVRARFSIRVLEIVESLKLIREALDHMKDGPAQVPVTAGAGESLGWSESFRGAVIDWVRLDAHGRIERCAISDPSFCNWPLFGELGPGNIVPDFPLCNKSLNLSYSGTDL